MGFTRAQVEQLLRPINSDRVLRDGKGNSHVSQQDVTAHLIRIFGFGNFDTEILGEELIFESERTHPQTGKPTGRWDVCYKAKIRLTVKDQHGVEVCHMEDGSTATAQNQTRGDAHDLALKSALSLAKKRCAVALGDQFGLSLYNKGQLKPLVMRTLAMPAGDADDRDLQEGVEQQVAMGNDEIDRSLDADEADRQSEPVTDPAWLARMESAIAAATPARMDAIAAEIRTEESAGRVEQEHGEHLLHLFQQRQAAHAEAQKANQTRQSASPLASKAMLTKLHTQFNALSVKSRDEGLMVISLLTGRKVSSSKELTVSEAKAMIDLLEPLTAKPDPSEALNKLLQSKVDNGGAHDHAA